MKFCGRRGRKDRRPVGILRCLDRSRRARWRPRRGYPGEGCRLRADSEEGVLISARLRDAPNRCEIVDKSG